MPTKFYPPFHIEPPLPDKVFRDIGGTPPDKWEVVDTKVQTISTHDTVESAKRGLEAASKLYPYEIVDQVTINRKTLEIT